MTTNRRIIVKTTVDDDAKCVANFVIDDNEEKSIWIDFSSVSVNREKIAHYTTEIVLGWLIATCKRGDIREVEVQASHGPRRHVVETWCLMAQVHLVALEASNPFEIREGPKEQSSSVCISWGGGKDSYAALDILSRVAESSRLILFDFTHFKSTAQVRNREERRKKFSSSVVQESFGAEVITITSNAPSQIDMPNTANYFAFIPFLATEFGIKAFCYSFESMFFYDSWGNTIFPVNRNQNYDMSRTLLARVLSWRVSDLLGREFFVFNANYQFTEFSAFTYVAKFCEGGLDRIMMCENGGENKWCLRCTKCAQLVLYSMALDVAQKQIDKNDFLENSIWVKKAIDSDGNWYKGLTYPGHFDSFRYVLWLINAAQHEDLSPRARENLNSIKTKYQSLINEEDGFFVKNLFASWPTKYADKVYRLLSDKLPAYESPAFKKSWGNNPVYRNEELQAASRAVQLCQFLMEGRR